MSTMLSILVTDVNHHVRDLLKREFQKEGHTVYLAKNGSEAAQLIFSPCPLDLMIFDPEIPELSGRSLLLDALDRVPPIQVIVHTYKELFSRLSLRTNLHFVEKSADSIHPLLDRIRQFSSHY